YHPDRQRRDDDFRSRRQVERLEDVVEGHPAVRGGDGMSAAGPALECAFELGDLGTLDEFAARLRAGDDFFGLGKDSRAVARDRSEHKGGTGGKAGPLLPFPSLSYQQATGREMSAIS